MPDLRQRLESALAGRYEVVREVGRGGMSIVYLARDLRHSREVAVKVLRPELVASLGTERFLREIQVAAALSHPHIVPLFDSGGGEGCLFYVMPYVPGESLRERLLRQGRLPVAEAVVLAREVADALEFAHRAGVVHRDVKPENILLQAGHAVVSDFGIARAIKVAAESRVTATGIAVGTPDYMSPEQAAGNEDVDGRSDIYSLGCVAFEMLVGRAPFHGTTPQKILAQKLGAAPPELSSLEPVPDPVARAVARALAKDPEDRFATAAQFATALAKADARSPWSLGWRRRRLLVAASCVVVIAVAVGWWTARGTLTSGRESEFDPRHLAVLYFDVQGDRQRLDPVAAGLTEDLIDALNQVPTLTVISAAGVRPLRDRAPPTDSIARAFAVGTIVSGSVGRNGDSLRVAVRLVDAASGRQLHSQVFVHAIVDLFALEDSLTDDIARFLRRRLGETLALSARRSATRSVEAWELIRHSIELQVYARGLGRQDGGAARRTLDQADSLARQAAAVDPTWIEPLLRRGWLSWSQAVVARGSVGGSTDSSSDFSSRIRSGLGFADRALTLRPGDPRARELRGILLYQLWAIPGLASADSLRSSAETDLRAAVRADPDRAAAWYTLSQLLSSRGELAEAEAAAVKAYEKDAFLEEAEDILAQLFTATLQRAAFQESARWCKEGQRRYPEDPNFLECRLWLLGWSGRGPSDIRASWREYERIDTIGTIIEGRPYRLLLVADVLARSGWKDSASAVVRETRRRFPHDDVDLQEASVQLLQGERDSALALLKTFLGRHPGYRGYVANHYWFRGLQGDRRFDALTAARRP